MNFNKESLSNRVLDLERRESFLNVIAQNCHYRIKKWLQPNPLKFNNLKILQRNLVQFQKLLKLAFLTKFQQSPMIKNFIKALEEA